MALDNTLAGASADSYATLEDVTAYFGADHVFTLLAEEEKERLLRKACFQIDTFRFHGLKYKEKFGIGSDQALKFPRDYNTVSDNDQTDLPVLPKDVIYAQIEQAFYLSNEAENSRRAQMQSDGVTAFSLGDLSETYGNAQKGGNEIPMSLTAKAYLKKYISKIGSFKE